MKTKFDEKRKPVICQIHFPGARLSACFTTLLQQSEVSVSIEQTSRNTELKKKNKKSTKPLNSSLAWMFKSLVFVPRRFFRKFFLQVEQCRLFNSLISCRQDNYQQSFIMLARYLLTTIYPAAGRIFFVNFISYKQEIFSCLYGHCHNKYNFGNTLNALLPNFAVVKSVTLFKKIINVRLKQERNFGTERGSARTSRWSTSALTRTLF